VEGAASPTRMEDSPMSEKPLITYHELRKISPSKARELVRKVLERANYNVSLASRILGISRRTVRRARDGPLEDRSRRPHHCPRRTPEFLEELILREARRTGFRARNLASYMERKYGLRFKESTIKVILKRNGVSKRMRKSAKGIYRALYDYEALLPFQEFQLDTKHLLDKYSLPKEVYEHIKRRRLPLYEWNMIDIATRARFTAYSYELSSVFGMMFIVMVVLWLRAHNVRNPIRIRVDNGAEFTSGSRRKLREYNELLKPLGVELEAIPGAKHLMAVVEASHRADDEWFLMIHAERCKNKEEFLLRAQRWQDTWNFFRAHHGKGMKGLTPFMKLKERDSMIHHHVLLYPVVLMEDVIGKVGIITEILRVDQGGKYVFTKCQII